MNFEFVVQGNHPIFMYVNRGCFTIEEAENVKRGLETIGYIVEIKKNVMEIKEIIDE